MVEGGGEGLKDLLRVEFEVEGGFWKDLWRVVVWLAGAGGGFWAADSRS